MRTDPKQAGTDVAPVNETAGALANPIDPARVVEQVALKGDLKALTPAERVQYFQAICDSVGLNPLTHPFNFLETRDGRLILYANKNCTDQLRFQHRISLSDPVLSGKDGCYVATVHAMMPNGTRDSDIGAVAMPSSADDRANAMKKAITQAKRRVTLSICGLSALDESEVDQVPGAQRQLVDFNSGEIMPQLPAPPSEGARSDYGDEDPEREKRRLFVQVKDIRDQASGDAFAVDLCAALNRAVRTNGTSHFALWGDYTDACGRMKIDARRKYKGVPVAPTTDTPLARKTDEAAGDEVPQQEQLAAEPVIEETPEEREERIAHEAELEG